MFGVAKDPIGFAGGLTSLYDYVGEDPVNFVDPSGKLGIVGGVAGAIIGGITGRVDGAI